MLLFFFGAKVHVITFWYRLQMIADESRGGMWQEISLRVLIFEIFASVFFYFPQKYVFPQTFSLQKTTPLAKLCIQTSHVKFWCPIYQKTFLSYKTRGMCLFVLFYLRLLDDCRLPNDSDD